MEFLKSSSRENSFGVKLETWMLDVVMMRQKCQLEHGQGEGDLIQVKCHRGRITDCPDMSFCICLLTSQINIRNTNQLMADVTLKLRNPSKS